MKTVSFLFFDPRHDAAAVPYACRRLGISFEILSNRSEADWESIRNMRLTAPAAVFHMDFFTYSTNEKDALMRERSIIRIHHMLELLPESTRRVYISNASTLERGIINSAIELGGDILITAKEIREQSDIENTVRLLVQLGYATADEINQRGRSIKNMQGKQEGMIIAPERPVDERFSHSSDLYYKSGKE